MAAPFVDVVAYLIHVNINSWDILIATSNTFILRKRIGEKTAIVIGVQLPQQEVRITQKVLRKIGNYMAN